MGKKSREKRDRRRAKADDQQRAQDDEIAARMLEHSTSHDLAALRTSYASRWRVTAGSFDAAGHYEWMAEQVRDYHRVLEVGTGVGHSTLALLRAGHQVVGVDENPDCLQQAKNLITASGMDCELVLRGDFALGKDGHYTIAYAEVAPSQSPPTCLLVEGDVLGDTNLITWLEAENRFDAVVCWLIGTHKARPASSAVRRSGIGSVGEYRLLVQNTVYELADHLLRPAGMLNVIDRGEHPLSDILRTDAYRGHCDQAGPTSLVVQPFPEVREYRPESPDGGIGMQATLGCSGRTPTSNRVALISWRSMKPDS